MKLLADLHTHSNHSRFRHGKSTIIEMIMHANELGLQELAITDHAYKHLFRTSKDKLYDARLTIDDMNKWSKTKIILGIEADILDENGTLDIDNETLALVDIVLAGYHRMIKTDFAGFFGKQEKTPEAKQKATNAFLNAINKYPISIVTHLNSVLDLDLYQIGRACAEKGTLVEINNRHPEWTSEQIEELLASGCSFVISSDAHSREEIGEVTEALEVVTKYNIPKDRIANLKYDYNEMTDEEREFELYFEEFKKRQEKVEKEVQVQQVERENSTPKLSKEMEDELEKIAHEKGYYYSRPKTSEPNSGAETKDESSRFVEDFSRFGVQGGAEYEAGQPDTTAEVETDEAGEPDREIAENEWDDRANRRAPEARQEQSEVAQPEASESSVQVESKQVQSEPEQTNAQSEPEQVQAQGGAEAQGEPAQEQGEAEILPNQQVAPSTAPAKKPSEEDSIVELLSKPRASTHSKLSKGGVEIERNVKEPKPKEKPEEPEKELEGLQNMFRVNVAQSKTAAKKTEENTEKKEEKSEKTPAKKRSGAGGLVDISDLTQK